MYVNGKMNVKNNGTGTYFNLYKYNFVLQFTVLYR